MECFAKYSADTEWTANCMTMYDIVCFIAVSPTLSPEEHTVFSIGTLLTWWPVIR